MGVLVLMMRWSIGAITWRGGNHRVLKSNSGGGGRGRVVGILGLVIDSYSADLHLTDWTQAKEFYFSVPIM